MSREQHRCSIDGFRPAQPAATAARPGPARLGMTFEHLQATDGTCPFSPSPI
jgi:hypothetical protein